MPTPGAGTLQMAGTSDLPMVFQTSAPSTWPPPVGDSDDIVRRVKRLIPGRWFAWVAPYRDALLGGLGDSAAWCYSWIGYAQLQTRLATATGPWLDIFAYDYLNRYLLRAGMDDGTYRTLVRATILQERVTRAGVEQALTTLMGGVPQRIIEPWNTGDCGAWGTGYMGYGRAGAWGTLQRPGQFFMQLSRRGVGPTGVPGVAGWSRKGSPIGFGGYGVGATMWGGVQIAQIGVTDQNIYDMIRYTKPTGSTAWVQFR